MKFEVIKKKEKKKRKMEKERWRKKDGKTMEITPKQERK